MLLNKSLPFVCRDYKFTEVIGQGGFSKVFKVTNIKFGTEFVAKVLHVRDEAKVSSSWETFDSEVSNLLSLDHPHIIRLYDHFHEGSDFVIILELCEQGSLSDEIKQNVNGLPLERFKVVARQVCESLAYCHSKNIAHHDIKPQNILIDQYGRAKLADFGLSLKSEDGELSTQFAGSLIFIPPEIFKKKAHDPFKADVWSLGVMFVFMITGESPWPNVPIERLKQLIFAGAYQLSRRVPHQVADLIRKMIVVDPDARIPIEKILQLPWLKEDPDETDLNEKPADPLSPRGRRVLSPHGPSRGLRAAQSLEKIENERGKSKAILIGVNSLFGVNRPSRLRSRTGSLVPTFSSNSEIPSFSDNSSF